MMAKNKDTLFIDMKYIILYRKLGFVEIEQDVFEYQYSDIIIRIESEKQRFLYQNKHYDLLAYKDFVLLECIDRLLKKGYSASNIIIGSKYDLSIIRENKVLVNIFVAQWGKDYEKLLQSCTSQNSGCICAYTSQLSGGLVDFISRIYTNGTEYDKGIFENGILPYQFEFSNKEVGKQYSSEFIVADNELIKYIGHEKKVVVPNGIRRIGAGAFWNCLFIEEVQLPETITCICGDAFVYCDNLKYTNIPSLVDEIGDDPWAGCKELSIKNDSSNFVIDKGVVFDKSRRILIHYFPNNEAEKYLVPESVEWIGKHSFYKCQRLKAVVITKNVKFMGNNAFSDCENIHLKNESDYFSYVGGILYNKDKTTAMHYSMGSGVQVVTLEKTTRTIGRNCFWNCKMIKKLIIPSSIRQIGYNPFASCSNIEFENHSENYTVENGILYDNTLTELVCCPSTAVDKKGEVKILDTVVNIGRNSFTGCEKLKGIKIPSSVKFVSRGAFSGCTSLEKIDVPNSIESIGDWCFNGCTALKEVSIPKHIQLAQNVFNSCDATVKRG